MVTVFYDVLFVQSEMVLGSKQDSGMKPVIIYLQGLQRNMGCMYIMDSYFGSVECIPEFIEFWKSCFFAYVVFYLLGAFWG